MIKKTLIFSNTGLSSWQIGINTEVIDHLSREERELLVVNCDSKLNNCYFNKTHNPIGCALCQSRQKNLYNLIGLAESNQVSLQALFNDIQLPDFANLEELVNYTYEGYNIGRGVASSIISYYREYEISTKSHGSIIKIELIKSVNVLYNFKKIIRDFQPDEIYVFNGRFSEVWPVILLAEKLGIDYFCIESGSPGKYEIFKNSLPHSINNRHNTIVRLWEQADKTTRISKATKWYHDRRFKTNYGEIQFTNQQKKRSST